MTAEKQLEKYFEFKKSSGWIALKAKPEFDLSGFQTRRIAKLLDSNSLQFTIGATKLGTTRKLNDTIRAIIKADGVGVVERKSTAGNTEMKKEYPGFNLRNLSDAKFDSIILQVFTAIKQVQTENSI